MSQLTPAQRCLHCEIEKHLAKIEKLLPAYRLTLIAKYHGPEVTKDMDILLTLDTRDNMLKVIDRFLPEQTRTE